MAPQLSFTPNFNVVFFIVNYPSYIYSVLLDLNSGALAGLSPGGIVVDMTTLEPFLVVEIATLSQILT